MLRKLHARTALADVVATDENATVKYWKGRAERLFGQSKAEIVGRDLFDNLIPAMLKS
jgi:PAS domain S-box-containing protein